MELQLDSVMAKRSVLESASAFQLDSVMVTPLESAWQSQLAKVQVKALGPASKRYVCSVDRSA